MILGVHRRRRVWTAALLASLALLWSAEPLYADPPPWAPAHGYRAKHKEKSKGKYKYNKKKGYHEPVYAPPFDIDVGRCNRAVLGSVLGGAAGAAVGAKVGDGKKEAIIGGTIIGILVGGVIGRAMDEVDQNCIGQVLEHAEDGENIRWNDERGDDYRVTPIRTYQTEAGSYCREYTTKAVIGGRLQETYGRACRQPDGSWKLVS